MTVDLPSNDSTALPYQWTAVIHSAYLAQLSAAALHQPSVLLPFSPLHPGCVGHVPSLTSSTARPAAAVQPNSKHIQPQVFTKHPFGLSVQCNLMQQGTVTALTELIAGTARMHTCLNRIQQLMKQQQQQLSRHDSAAGHDSVAGQRQLAWHVVSSAVVQLKQIGLTFATLEVRPPPPWNSKVLQVGCHTLAFLSKKGWLQLISDMKVCSRSRECTLWHAVLRPMADILLQCISPGLNTTLCSELALDSNWLHAEDHTYTRQ